MCLPSFCTLHLSNHKKPVVTDAHGAPGSVAAALLPLLLLPLPWGRRMRAPALPPAELLPALPGGRRPRPGQRQRGAHLAGGAQRLLRRHVLQQRQQAAGEFYSYIVDIAYVVLA